MIKIDKTFKFICLSCALVSGVLIFGFFIQLILASTDAWQQFGLNFIFSSEWNPTEEKFGAFSSIIGTLITTTIALIIALPLAFSAALYLSDARPIISSLLSNAIDLLAAIPSIIYGMWGLFILAPCMQKYIQPFLVNYLHIDALPFFSNKYNGFGLLTAGLILGVMILPYICAIMRDVFQMTPAILKESAYGLACTKWETAKDIVLRYGIRSILGGIFIGLGRALGETMAVLFVIGNLMVLPNGLFESGTTISATLANNFAEADGIQRSSLFALGLILLTMSFGIQIFAQYYLFATSRKRGER